MATYTEDKWLLGIEVLNLEWIFPILFPTNDALVQEDRFLKKMKN